MESVVTFYLTLGAAPLNFYTAFWTSPVISEMNLRNRSRFVILMFVVLSPVVSAQPSLFDHLFWEAQGHRPNQLWGMSGLSYLGRLNDTIQHAVAIGEITGSFNGDVRRDIAALVFNRDSLDTVRHYEFPGTRVWRCNMNGDSVPDFVCWDGQQRTITVLFGTPNPIVFDTALRIQGDINHQ